ncbi:MAG: protein kinase [Polyangiaceae bacterium]|jgi:serine/threonine-protein kinase
MNSISRGSSRPPDQVIAQSGSVKVDDDERVYVAAGDVIGGKYRIERILGVGGMGFVVAAKHVQLDGAFALKFLKKRFLHDRGVVDRFTREAKAVCRIRSDYVARVFDVGTWEGAPYLVMEHLVGRDLAAVLAEQGRLGAEDAVEYTVQACAALAAAHACGVVHRDIKPENLFLVENDGLSTVKLLDFGISLVALTGLATEPNASRLTGTLTLGTPLYMSPEQIRSTASADGQSDLWSLGVVLYELLTGTVPFNAGSVNEICAAILEKDPPSLLQARPDAPVGLADVLERCLQKDPARRFRNVSELAVSLLGFAPSRSLAVAESSAAIRRAAIEAIGVGPESSGRTTAKSIRTLSLGAPASTSGRQTPASAVMEDAPVQGLVGQPDEPAAGRARRMSSKRTRAAMAAGAVALAATVAAAVLHGRHGSTPAERTDIDQGIRQPPPASTLIPTATATQQGLASPPPDIRVSAAAPPDSPHGARPVPVSARNSSPTRWMPPPQSASVATRVTPPQKVQSAASPATPEVAPTPAAAPLVSPGRPDLGY